MVAVLFDLFETLVTEGPSWTSRERDGARSWKLVAAEQLGVPESTFASGWNSLKGKRMTSVIPYEDVLVEICHQSGVVADLEVVAALANERLTAKAACFSDVDEQVLEMLDDLLALDVPIAILSNCSGEEVEAIAASPIGARIRHRFFSYDLGHAKPSLSAYRLACGQLGVPAEGFYFVGVGSFDELIGARAAGLTPIWATWFMCQWPTKTALRHEAAMTRQTFQRAKRPADVTTTVRSALRADPHPHARPT